jgi:hypothetical protein
MRRLAEIPRLGPRLKLFLTILTWKDGARKFLEKVQILEDAADEMKAESCKRQLTKIFSWMLAIGPPSSLLSST